MNVNIKEVKQVLKNALTSRKLVFEVLNKEIV